MNSLIYRAHHPQRRQRDNLLIPLRIAGPILDGSLGGLLNEECHRRRKIDHWQRRLVRGLSWIDQLDFMKRLNFGAVSLVLIDSRARLIQAAKGGIESTRFAQKMRRSHALENQLAGHKPRVPERLHVRCRALVFSDDAPPIAGLNDASGSKPYWSEVKIMHLTKMPRIPSAVERG